MDKKELISAYKFNCLAIASHHKRHCEGEDCVVSLLLLMQMAESLGVKFTSKQMEKFI